MDYEIYFIVKIVGLKEGMLRVRKPRQLCQESARRFGLASGRDKVRLVCKLASDQKEKVAMEDIKSEILGLDAEHKLELIRGIVVSDLHSQRALLAIMVVLDPEATLPLIPWRESLGAA